jgi:hypothetical protein
MLKHALLSLPHSYAPRLDTAVHLRTQFHHFEQEASVDNPLYRKVRSTQHAVCSV